MKQCTKCKKFLPYSDFYRHSEKVRNKLSSKVRKDGYYPACKKCEYKRTSKYHKKNYEHLWKFTVKRRSKLVTYLRNKYTAIRARSRRHKKEFNLSFFDFLRAFIVQMRVTNFHCMYNPEIKLTHKVGKGNKGKIYTNISVDRLDNEEWYTKNNLIFCSWGENDKKGATDFNNLAMVQVWALWLNKEKWEASGKRAQNYLTKMRKNKPKTLRSIRNEMEQAVPISEVDTGNDWEQKTLFD